VTAVMDFSEDERTEQRRRRKDIGGGVRLTWDSGKTTAMIYQVIIIRHLPLFNIYGTLFCSEALEIDFRGK
jgi:hypothetical protein